MNSKVNNEKEVTAEVYKMIIADLIEKVNPMYLKRIYDLARYLYVWK